MRLLISSRKSYLRRARAIVVAALALMLVPLASSPPATSAEDQFGPICLRYYVPTQLQGSVGDQFNFDITNFVPSTTMFVEIWELDWGDGSIDFSSAGEQLSYGQTRRLTHAYLQSGTFLARFEWNGGFQFPDGTFKRPDGQPGTCNHERVFFVVNTTQGGPNPNPMPSIRLSDASATEKRSGDTVIDFTASLSQPTTQNVTVEFASSNGTAMSTFDYGAISGLLTIPAGQTTGIISTHVRPDRLIESDETFVVTLSNSQNATITDGEGVGTIKDSPTGIDCLPVGSATAVLLSHVDVPVQIPGKSWSLSYGDLPLDFTSKGESVDSFCTFESNRGVLDVNLKLPGLDPARVATSTASATLTFPKNLFPAIPRCNFSVTDVFPSTENDCFLNEPPGPLTRPQDIVSWTTTGFEMRVHPEAVIAKDFVTNTGPLTFYVNLDPLLPFRPPPTGELVQIAETFIHTNLISRLPGVTKWAVFQDPPADILITDPLGRRTGRGSSGTLVAQIPGSGYLESSTNKAIVLADPTLGSYSPTMSGSPHDPFSLSVSFVDVVGKLTAPAVSTTNVTGTLGRKGRRPLCFDLPHSARCAIPTDKEQCKEGGYKFFGFKNQGQCIKAARLRDKIPT